MCDVYTKKCIVVTTPDIPGQLANVTEALRHKVRIYGLCSMGNGITFTITMVVNCPEVAIQAIHDIKLPPGQEPYIVSEPMTVIIVACRKPWSVLARALANDNINIDQAFNIEKSRKAFLVGQNKIDTALDILKDVCRKCYCRKCRKC